MIVLNISFFCSLFSPSLSPLSSNEGVHKILVATSEGVLYVSSIDPKEGGECRYRRFKYVSFLVILALISDFIFL